MVKGGWGPGRPRRRHGDGRSRSPNNKVSCVQKEEGIESRTGNRPAERKTNKMSRTVEQVLKEMGWAQGAGIPVADEENKQLEKEIEDLLRKKANTIIDMEKLDSRIESMTKMVKNVKNEKESNENVISALKRQLESAYTTLKMREFQSNKMQQEIKTMRKEVSSSNERASKISDELAKQQIKVQELKSKVEWGEDTLFAWDEELSRQERDQDFLEALKNKDSNKIKDIFLKVKQAREDFEEVKKAEQNILDKIICLETELQRSCQTIKEVNAEKTRLISIWERTIQAMKLRDMDIIKKSKEMEEVKSLVRDKYQKFNDRRSIYEKQKRINQELQESLDAFENESDKIRFRNRILEDEVKDLKSEIFVYTTTLGEISSKVESQRLQNSEIEKNLNMKQSHTGYMEAENQNLLGLIKTIQMDTSSSEQRSASAEQVFEMGRKAQQRMMKELDRTQDVICRLQMEIPKIKSEIKAREDQLVDTVNLDTHLTKQIEVESNEFKEDDIRLYNLEYELSEISGKITEAKSRNKTETISLWNKKLEDLEEKCNLKKSTYIDLKTEVKRALDNSQSVKNTLKKIEAEKEQYSNQIKQMNLQIEGLDKTVKWTQEQYNQSLLELNLVKMQTNVLKENMSKQGSNISRLEKERICLESAMKERKLEIEAQKELLLAKKRSLEDERSSHRRSIEHLNIRIKQLQKKYEIAIDMLGKSSDGEQISITLLKIKTAQEKIELQQEGDELEVKIEKAEKEIEAMENTLRLLTNANLNFKKNLDPIDNDGPEMQERNKLEVQSYMLNNHLKEKYKRLEEVKSELKELEDKLGELEIEEESIHDEWKAKDKELSDLEKDLANKQMKLDRAAKHLEKLKRDIGRMKSFQSHKTIYEKDMEVRLKTEQNNAALQQLGELAHNYIETGPMVNRYLEEKGLSIPKSRGSLSSSRNSISMSLISFSSRSLDSNSSRTSSDWQGLGGSLPKGSSDMLTHRSDSICD